MSWLDNALCKDVHPFHFSYVEKGEPGYVSDAKDHKRRVVGERGWNKMRLQKSADFCFDCPVMIECGEEASPLEKFWTVRGGELPEILERGGQKNKTPLADINSYLPDVCGRGHSYWLVRSDGKGRYCGECN